MILLKNKSLQFADDNLLYKLDSISLINIMNVSSTTNILRYTLPYKTNYWNIGGMSTYQQVSHIKRPLNFTMPNNHLFAREIINGLRLNN